MKLHTIIVILLSLLIAAGSTVAQTATQQEDKEKSKRYLYEWRNDKGAVHISDDLGDVPEKYLKNVRKILQGSSEHETGQSVQGTSAPAQEFGQESRDEAQKAVWQQRIGEQKLRLAGAENRYHQLEQERSELLGSWHTRSYVPPESMARVERIEQEMKQVQKEIDDTRNRIDVVIPEEARKAGIPPGWLRE
jgi:hypothetical protein